MITYMTGPHGVHIAYDEQEVERCKANGWVVRELQALNEARADEPLPVVKKRGRPRKS